jgi:hypothetical protein
MKKMAVFGFFIGLLAFSASLYIHFVLAPVRAAAQDQSYAMLYFENQAHQEKLWDIMEYVNNMTYGMLLVAIVGVLINIPPVVKKYKLAWIGMILSLVATFIGLVHGTHIFS